MRKTFEVANERDDIVIWFDKKLVDREALSRLLRYVEMEPVRKRSEMTAAQATVLANEIDRAVWEKVKHNYVQE